MDAELFWKSLTVAALVWYSSVTVYVAVRGAADIRQMLRRLSERSDASEPRLAAKDRNED